jgi:hypothetical protein
VGGEGRWNPRRLFSKNVKVWVAWRLTRRMLCSSGWTATTHSQELEAFQALAGDYCDELHFGEEADF